MPRGGLLIRIGRLQQRILAKRLADELQTDRQSFCITATRDREPGQTGKVDGDGADVGQVHRQGVRGFLAEPECYRGRHRRGTDVAGRKGGEKVVPAESADLLRLEEVGSVVPLL